MCRMYMLKILMLRGTSVTDDALYDFLGSFLESLDVSETMVMIFCLFLIFVKDSIVSK